MTGCGSRRCSPGNRLVPIRGGYEVQLRRAGRACGATTVNHSLTTFVNRPLTMNWAKFAQGGDAAVTTTDRRQALDAGAFPVFRTGGPTAAPQTLGARDRNRRGGSATMSDVTAKSGIGGFQLPTLGYARRAVQARRPRARGRRDDHPGRPHPAAAGDPARPLPRLLDHPLGADPDDGAVHSHAARVLLLSDRAADRHDAAALAQPRLHAPHPGARPRGHGRRRPRHRSVRQLRDGRQLRHRHHRVHDPGDRELRRHHQGLRPHRRGRGPLQPRRHAGQADGDRRRPLRRPDRGEGRAPPPQAAGRRERLLRRHGRRLEVRARRRHCRPAGRVHQRDRRHDHRHRPAGHAVRRSGPHLHAADRRRRPGHASAGADRLDRGRPARLQGGRRAAASTRRCSGSCPAIPRRSACRPP